MRKILIKMFSLIKRFLSDDQLKVIYFFTNSNPRYSIYDIGQGTYGNPYIFGDSSSKLVIGKYCSIADLVTIMCGSEHRTDWITTYPFNVIIPEAMDYTGHPHTKGDVIIGNDVWIGRGALILSGVTIGDGAVIGAHSVVSKNVEPYSIVAGNPARHIRYRFGKDIIDKLSSIEWWNWEENKILEALPLLLSTNIEAFITKYYIEIIN